MSKEEYDEAVKRLSSEKTALESEMRAVRDRLRTSESQRKELEERLVKSNQALSEILDEIVEMDGAFSALEERLKAGPGKETFLDDAIAEETDTVLASEENLEKMAAQISFLEKFVHDKEQVLSGLEGNRKDAEATIASLGAVVAEKNKALAELQERLSRQQKDIDAHIRDKGIISVQLKEVESLRAAHETLLEKTATLEKALMGEEKSKAELQNALKLKNANIEALKKLHVSETHKRDLGTCAPKVNSVEADHFKAEQESAFLQGAASEQKSSPSRMEAKLNESEDLIKERQALSDQLAESMKESRILRGVGTFLSAEVKRLEEELKKIKEENASSGQHSLKNGSVESDSGMSESTEKQERPISPDAHAANGQEGIPSDSSRESFPSALSWQSRQRVTWSPRKKMAFSLLFLFFLVVSAGIPVREDIYNSLTSLTARKNTVPSETAVKRWAEGIKQSESGDYVISLVFLNREAISVLGLSGKITDAGMADNLYAFFEVKAEHGCIPDGFLSSIEKVVFFFDDKGTLIRLNAPEAMASEKKVIYKKEACEKESGAVDLKSVISARKNARIAGMTINGLNTGSPLIVR